MNFHFGFQPAQCLVCFIRNLMHKHFFLTCFFLLGYYENNILCYFQMSSSHNPYCKTAVLNRSSSLLIRITLNLNLLFASMLLLHEKNYLTRPYFHQGTFGQSFYIICLCIVFFVSALSRLLPSLIAFFMMIIVFVS